MAYGELWVLSEAYDAALEYPTHISLAGLFLLFSLLEVSGLGIVCRIIYTRQQEKDDDLERVRELQQQMGVLKTVRSNREEAEKQGTAKAEGETEEKQAPGSPKKRNIDISALSRSPVRSGNAKPSAQSSLGTAETDGSSLAISKDDPDDSEVDNSNSVKEKSSSSKSEEPNHASNVYESVKDAWTWGRHETPFSPILGFAEGITGNAIGLFGMDMKGIDDALKPRVADLDEHVLKPTLSTVGSFLEDLGKGDDHDDDDFEEIHGQE